MSTPNKGNGPAPAHRELPADADPYLKGAMAALQRAAERARQVALQTGTDLILFRDGQVVRVNPGRKE